MFVVLGFVLSFFSLLEVARKDKFRTLNFYIFALVLTLMLCLRYGQGTDYYEYELQYVNIDISGSYFVNSLYHGEIGWYMLMLLFKRLGASFSLYLGIVSLFMMILVIKVINRYSSYRIFSLLLLYPTFYLTYFYSAIRQGLVLVIFLSFGIDCLLSRKYFKYYIVVILMALLHRSSLILIVLPFVLRYRDRKPGKFLMISIFFATICGYSGVLNTIAERLGVRGYFNVSISVMAILLRIILFYMISFMYKATKVACEENKEIDILYFIYSFGFLFFVMFAFSSTLSQRLTVPLKCVEILLIPMLVERMSYCRENRCFSSSTPVFYIKLGDTKALLFVILIVVALNIELIKNINAYLGQGNYYD